MCLADKGYFSSREILICFDAGITTTVLRRETLGNRGKGYVREGRLLLRTRQGRLSLPGRRGAELSLHDRRGGSPAQALLDKCGNCPIKSRCTTGKERRVTRWEHEHLIEEAQVRLRNASEPMTARRFTVEHPFGTIKAWREATHFLTRRLPNVKTEMVLNVLTCNIKRMVALICIRSFVAAIRG